MRYFLLFPLMATLRVSAPTGTANSQSDFTGNWLLDASQSQAFDESSTRLLLDQQPEQLVFHRWFRGKNGVEVERSFTCTIGGANCSFSEGGHHSKVSLWFNGPALVILKTDGPKQSETIERTLTLSPDGQTLTMQYSDIAKGDNPKKLLFLKSGAMTSKTANASASHS